MSGGSRAGRKAAVYAAEIVLPLHTDFHAFQFAAYRTHPLVGGCYPHADARAHVAFCDGLFDSLVHASIVRERHLSPRNHERPVTVLFFRVLYGGFPRPFLGGRFPHGRIVLKEGCLRAFVIVEVRRRLRTVQADSGTDGAGQFVHCPFPRICAAYHSVNGLSLLPSNHGD